MPHNVEPRAREVRRYRLGFVLALALTGGSFAVVHWRWLGASKTLAVVLFFALAQALVQFRYFLNISLARSARDDLRLILFAGLVIALMVGGSLVVLLNLRHRMM